MTAVGSNAPVQNVEVSLFTATGLWLDEANTAADGTYSFLNLAPQAASATTGYVVCFNGFSTNSGTFLYQCYDQVG